MRAPSEFGPFTCLSIVTLCQIDVTACRQASEMEPRNGGMSRTSKAPEAAGLQATRDISDWIGRRYQETSQQVSHMRVIASLQPRRFSGKKLLPCS